VIKYHNTGKIQQIGFSKKRGNRVKKRMATHRRMDILRLRRSLLGTKIYEKGIRNLHQLKINMQQLHERRRTSNGTPLETRKAFMKDLLEAYQNQKQPQPSLLY
jgi:hypothetical protein